MLPVYAAWSHRRLIFGRRDWSRTNDLYHVKVAL